MRARLPSEPLLRIFLRNFQLVADLFRPLNDRISANPIARLSLLVDPSYERVFDLWKYNNRRAFYVSTLFFCVLSNLGFVLDES